MPLARQVDIEVVLRRRLYDSRRVSSSSSCWFGCPSPFLHIAIIASFLHLALAPARVVVGGVPFVRLGPRFASVDDLPSLGIVVLVGIFLYQISLGSFLDQSASASELGKIETLHESFMFM